MGFADVQPGGYATDDVLGYAVENGLLSGYGNGLFGPHDTVTRAQVATILWRVAGEPAADAEDFSDVDYSQWYGAAVEWAPETGVVSGYGQTNAFGPEDPVTREQLAVMLANHATKVESLDASSDCAALDAIEGAGEVSSWARSQMGWAVDDIGFQIWCISCTCQTDGNELGRPSGLMTSSFCKKNEDRSAKSNEIVRFSGSGGLLPSMKSHYPGARSTC